MFSEARNILINGGSFSVHNVQNHGPTTIGGFERLQQAVATSAFHDAGDSFDPPKCHPNTRIAVINRVMNWILGLGEDDKNAVILWFYGPAGAGKTAIAHNIAERCDLGNLLLASFFFSRSDPARNNSKSFITTIAYQIAINIPRTREKIVAAIERDPLLLTRSHEAQAISLIVSPLHEPLEEGYFDAPTSRRLIIIDGLDECDNSAAQCSILEVISRLFYHFNLPLLVFIASRPERHINHSFSTGSLPEFHTTLALDDTYQPDDDIRLFLTDSFRRIRSTHPMRRYLDNSWPSLDVLKRLVKNSSGQFIYASTVVKYVSSIRHQPADRLNVILGIRPPRHAREMPFGELDALYRHIFSCVEDIETVLLISGFHLLSSSRYPTMDVQDLEHFFLLNQGDLEILFGDLGSVISLSNVRSPIQILHASLGDFLLDAARSKEFYIDTSSIHTACMRLCSQHNKQSSDNGGRHLSYAGHNLIWHYENTPPSAYSQLREEILNFPFHRPDSCFIRISPGINLFFYVPRFLSFIKALPIDDAHEIHNKNLPLVLNFITSKLHLYYSSSRLTLLLTFLSTSRPDYVSTDIVSLPSRLRITDEDALGLRALGLSGRYVDDCPWKFFQDFLDSNDPLALDAQRYAVAALACLKLLFGHFQPPASRITWFTQHSRAGRVRMVDRSQWHHQALRRENYRTRVAFYWHLRTRYRNQITRKRFLEDIFDRFVGECRYQSLRSNHLPFLLPKSGYSHNILDFARSRVFRFGYLQRNHPTSIKRAIFVLAKYIERVTGETAEVRACESIWGREAWFTAQ